VSITLTNATAIRRVRAANGPDSMSVTLPGASALTDADVETGGAVVTLTYNSIPFTGIVSKVRHTGSGRDESQIVDLVGLWTVLQKVTYMQIWQTWNIAGEVAETAPRSRVILGMDDTGARITAGQQIINAINYAISLGAPITLGTVDAGPQLPFDERENISVADVVLHVVRLMPDYVAWFNGSAFNCRRRASLGNVALAATDCTDVETTERRDLLVPGIKITYEKTHNYDGTPKTTIETDTAGTTSAWNTVHLNFDLQGRQRSYLKAAIETEDIPADLTTDKAFLKARVPWLESVADGDITIEAAARGSVDPLPRMLIKGPIPDWLNKDTEEETLTWTITVNIKVGDPAVLVETRTSVTVTAEIIATDAITRTYKRLASADSGEETPTGIAAALYTAWGTLQHEGSATLVQAECAGTYAPGQTITVNGITALIQSVDEDLVSGRTVVRFGPPARIEADSLIALFRGLRSRRYAWSRNERAGSEEPGGDGGDIDQGAIPPKSTATQLGGQTTRLRITASDGTYDHEIDLNPAGTAFADSGDASPTVITSREAFLLVLDAGKLVAKKVQVLCSAPYASGADRVIAPAIPETACDEAVGDPFVRMDEDGNFHVDCGEEYDCT
jgi:hypothetical protein